MAKKEKIPSRKGLIYVQENYFKKEGGTGSVESWMSEDKFAKFYDPAYLKNIKEKGHTGDAIGQNRWMYAESYDKMSQDVKDQIYEKRYGSEQNIESMEYCIQKHGKDECKYFLEKSKQLEKEKKQIKKEFERKRKLNVFDPDKRG